MIAANQIADAPEGGRMFPVGGRMSHSQIQTFIGEFNWLTKTRLEPSTILSSSHLKKLFSDELNVCHDFSMIYDWKSSVTSEDKVSFLRAKCASEPSAISETEVDLVHNPSGCISPDERSHMSRCACLATSIVQFFPVQISNNRMSIGRGGVCPF